jgi:HK97 family phage major capsid protein
MFDMEKMSALITEQGAAFEAFKAAHAEEIKKADAVTAEKLAKIETSLDTAVEAKAALEAKLAAERKEREALELRLTRLPGLGGSKADDKFDLELKSANHMFKGIAADQKRPFELLTAESYLAYKQAFNSFLRKNDRLLTAEEVKTLSVGSDPDGGYYVTPDLSGRIATKVFETSPMRQICSVQLIGTDALEGIEDLGEAGAGYAGEHATSGDTTTPQIGKWRIPVYWIDTEPKTTQQLLDDANVDVEAWLAGKVADKIARFENAEFVAGAAGKIRGFTQYTTAEDTGAGVTWGSIGFIKSGASADFAASNPADKLFDMIGAVKQFYLTGARWVTRRSVITKIRKFKEATTNGYLWQPGLQNGVPEMLLGYPVTRAEDMPTLAADSFSLAFGDFVTAYQIVDRMGIRVLRDPFTSKPYVKFYTTKRTGGGMVNYEAIKLMKFNT